jgi:hypothetical protein
MELFQATPTPPPLLPLLARLLPLLWLLCGVMVT